MNVFDVAALTYVLHEIDVTADVALLGQFTGVSDVSKAPPLNEQIPKALSLGETFFTRCPVGKCKRYVSDTAFEVKKPMLTVSVVHSLFKRLKTDIMGELLNYTFIQIDPGQVENYINPITRWGLASPKFVDAKESMESCSKCYALGEWDASVFHAMRVLEKGLRWLAGQFNAGPFPLTLKKPVELEHWESIIGNIQARIDDELRANITRTPERDELVAFYSRAAAEFRYFKDAWRNHIMHDRNTPHDEGTSGSVLNHVTSFMQILAERV